MRRQTRRVSVGGLPLGGGSPILVQSMLNVPIGDIVGNVEQAKRLAAAGCEIIRVTTPHPADAAVITALKKAVPVPIVADIHFDYQAALAAIEAGADKIRLNPGNIGGDDHVAAVAAACRARHIPIRIGVNGGSLEKDLLAAYGGITADAMVESALRHAALLEKHDFGDIVISIKASHVPTVVEAYRKLSARCDYPLHVGVTETGTYRMGLIKSGMGIGTLLLEGIGDTIRVSLTDAPENEVRAGFDILRAAGYKVPGPEIISCPTCGRTNIDVAGIAERVEERMRGCKKPVKIAVMGCIVNGPGEARDADIGIAGGKDCAMLFVKGQQIRRLNGDFVEEFCAEIERLVGE